MSKSSLYTRKRMDLDVNVLLTMLLFVVLSAGLLGYSVLKKKEIKECAIVEILVNGNKATAKDVFFNTGALLVFKAVGASKDKVKWDFGDRSKPEEGYTVFHRFSRQTTYTVRVIVNGRCSYEQKIIIKYPPELVDTVGIETQYIISDDQALVKEPVKFTTPVNAKTYEWYIENNSNYGRQNGRQVEFIFKSQDNYTVVLILDGDRKKKYSKTITVIKPSEVLIPEPLIEEEDIVVAPPPKPKPTDTAKIVIVAPPPVKKQAKRLLTEEQFKLYLQDVVCKGKKTEEFESYLCDGMQTRVVSKDKSETFEEFCNRIRGKNIKITSVTVNRGSDNCATSLVVGYDRFKKFIGIGKTICD